MLPMAMRTRPWGGMLMVRVPARRVDDSGGEGWPAVRRGAICWRGGKGGGPRASKDRMRLARAGARGQNFTGAGGATLACLRVNDFLGAGVAGGGVGAGSV